MTLLRATIISVMIFSLFMIVVNLLVRQYVWLTIDIATFIFQAWLLRTAIKKNI